MPPSGVGSNSDDVDNAVSRSRDPAGDRTAPASATRRTDSLEARLAAVERAITDGDTPVADLDDAEALGRRLEAVETAVEELEDRVADLEAASRALRGYAGGIQAVNEDVERRADLALAKAETIERSLRRDPGLETERLDIDAAAPSGSDAGPAGERAADSDASAAGDASAAADTAHASDADVEVAIESTDAPEPSDGVEAVAQAESSTGGACRSLSARIRDVL